MPEGVNGTGMLAGRNVALGVTGSIAAVRTVELAHEFRRHGAAVRAVTTDEATGIITPEALEFATDHPVVTELTGQVEHVDLCGREGWADVLLIAPATANTIGKLASAIDDTPVTTCGTTAYGADVPVVIAPAMHDPMYDHPGIDDAIERLESWGTEFVPPRREEGKAKIADDEAIVSYVSRATGDRPLAGSHVVVTSGPTRESVDPVRVLTNRASGKTGRAVAQACFAAGAEVTVVHDGGELPYASVEQVETGAQMREAVIEAAAEADAVVSAAAIGDFELSTAEEKLDSGRAYELELSPAPKLLDTVRESYPDLAIVGFKAEHDPPDDDHLVAAARDQIERVGAAFVVANDAAVMGEETTRALLVGDVEYEVVEGTKGDLGRAIARRLAETLG